MLKSKYGIKSAGAAQQADEPAAVSRFLRRFAPRRGLSAKTLGRQVGRPMMMASGEHATLDLAMPGTA